MKKNLTTITRLLLLTAVLLAAAAPAADSVHIDRGFFIMVAASGIAGVEAGRLAQSKGASVEIRKLGARLVRNHTDANRKLKRLAARKNVRLPTGPDVRHAAMQSALEAASAHAFDEAYIQGQIAAHEARAVLLREEIRSGKDADARAFAQETLPTVMAVLKELRRLSRSMSTTPARSERR